MVRGDTFDLDMDSAGCPGCHIAVDYVAAHAAVVLNSYGAAEFSGETAYDT